ncbi:helix-turn-helix domain-containing protein [Pedobacter borealis]|uniref:helix-turn-helix domain-containing protein n=1 Tax=Pedobacter borealis TaxID=475254 RepID=UPI0004932D5A|nr:helix-turn-helix transcriptional regulator [Pedobacter borealis]
MNDGSTPIINNIGRKIERLRKLRDMSQDTLAKELGISRQSVQRIEHSEEIDEEKLSQIAAVLGVTSDAIKNFNEEAMFNNIVNDHGTVFNYISTYQLNPIDKIVELYDQLLKSEREKVEILKSLLDKK